MNTMINTGRKDAICNIETVEAKYKATWVGQLCLKTAGCGWADDTCGDVFYQKDPPSDGYSNYFALFIRFGSLYITSGASAVEGVINTVTADDGEIIYSRYTHDYRISTDGTAFIDGGRNYVRTDLDRTIIPWKIVDGIWVKA